jgi:hypothetical protein
LTTFTGTVGVTTPLASILTDNPGTTAINGGLNITTGFQSYLDNVTLGGNTTLTSTTSGNITIGLVGPNGIYGFTTLVGVGGNIALIANSTANVKINGAISGVVTLNGTAGTSYIAPNPGNTGINLYLSTPVSPFVFIYTAPPAMFRLNNIIIDVATLFGRDSGLIVDPTVGHTNEPVSITYEQDGGAGTRLGLLDTDKLFSNYDLSDEENARKKNKKH